VGELLPEQEIFGVSGGRCESFGTAQVHPLTVLPDEDYAAAPLGVEPRANGLGAVVAVAEDGTIETIGLYDMNRGRQVYLRRARVHQRRPGRWFLHRLPNPKMMDIAVPANLACGRVTS
jgi:hypothetical protein